MKLLLTLFFAIALWGCQSSSLQHVLIETDVGNIVLEIDSEAAPITASNFLRYVDGDFYRGGSFYRTVRMDNQPDNDIRIEVIQGGANANREEDSFEPIVLERTNITGISHRDGVISMARGGADTATHSFFICIGDQLSLDYGGMRNPDGQGFAAFGRVIEGMEIVREIQSAEDRSQTLVIPVLIRKITRI